MNRAALALVVLAACATTSKSAATLDEHVRATTALEKFADALASTGMSVALPARVCEEESEHDARYVDDPGCVELVRNVAVSDSAVVAVYAVALVKAHLPWTQATQAKADALVAAYLAHDDAKLRRVAREVENEFDALRLKKPSRVAHRETQHRVEGESTHAPVSEVADAGPVAERAASERGVAHEGEAKHVDVGDAGPGAMSPREKLVGTWAYDGGPIRNIYAMCADGKYEVTFEVVDSSFEMAPDELPTVRGTWVFVDGDPPKITFSALGETMDAPLIKIGDDDIDITLDNENLHLTRRSKSASCD